MNDKYEFVERNGVKYYYSMVDGKKFYHDMITFFPQCFRNCTINPMNLHMNGDCPVCGWHYSGDYVKEITCPECGQLLIPL